MLLQNTPEVFFGNLTTSVRYEVISLRCTPSCAMQRALRRGPMDHIQDFATQAMPMITATARGTPRNAFASAMPNPSLDFSSDSLSP